jgi:hypothetical protein
MAAVIMRTDGKCSLLICWIRRARMTVTYYASVYPKGFASSDGFSRV